MFMVSDAILGGAGKCRARRPAGFRLRLWMPLGGGHPKWIRAASLGHRVGRCVRWASAAIGLFSGCSAAPGRYLEVCATGTKAPSLQPAGSVVLREDDSVRLGDPGASFVVAGNGAMYFPDFSSGQLLAFGRNGTYRGVIGRKGGGPGEFVGIGSFGLAVDSLLFFDDNAGRRLNVYSLRDERFVGAVRYEGYLAWLTASQDDLILGLTAMGSQRTIAIARRDSALRTMGRGTQGVLMSQFVRTPPEYATFPLLSEWSDTKVVDDSAGLVVAFGGLSYLVQQSAGADSQNVIEIPRCGRRGSPPESLSAWFRRRPTNAQEQLTIDGHTSRSISALLGMWRLSDGAVVVWYQDPWFENNYSALKGVAFISVLDKSLRRACLDARVEAPGLERPRIAMQGDTLLVLDQLQAEGPDQRVTSVVSRFLIDTSNCTWLATRVTRRPAS